MAKTHRKNNAYLIGELKKKLAIAHRILSKMGLADYLGHVSARVPGTDIVLIKGAGWFLGSLAETTARHIISIDLEGRPLEKGPPPPVEVRMHTSLYRSRQDIGSVVHTHQLFTTAFGLVGRPILPVHVNAGGASSEVLLDGIPIFDRPDLITTQELGKRVALTLGSHGACHLRGHGVIVVGKTVEEAILRAIEIELQAKLNWIASSLGRFEQLPRDSLERFIEAYVRNGHGSPPAYEGAWKYYSSLVDHKSTGSGSQG